MQYFKRKLIVVIYPITNIIAAGCIKLPDDKADNKHGIYSKSGM